MRPEALPREINFVKVGAVAAFLLAEPYPVSPSSLRTPSSS